MIRCYNKKFRALQDKAESLTEQCGKLSRELEEERTKSVLEKMDGETVRIILEAGPSVVLKRVNDDKDVYQKNPTWEIQIYKYGYDGNRLFKKTSNIGSIRNEVPSIFWRTVQPHVQVKLKNLFIPTAKDLSKPCRVFFSYRSYKTDALNSTEI